MVEHRFKHSYIPRGIFVPFHQRVQRWALLVAHRRAGKTVATINDQVSRALYFDFFEDPRFAYIAPFYSQAKKIAWAYLKRFAGPAAKPPLESELSITIRHNKALISLYGADNPDSFRGQYFDGVVLDEFGNMKPSVWSEVLLPTLIDRRGWATFIGTPNGPNHFKDLYKMAVELPESWFVDRLPVSRTKLIPEEELTEMRRLMSEEEYEQEMECNFDAPTRGAFYAKEIRTAELQGRIDNFPPTTDLKLHFVFDIGFRDDCSMGVFQEYRDGVAIVHEESENLRAAPWWIDRIRAICREFGCARGNVWLPHDSRAKTFQTGRSTWEQFLAHKIVPKLVPDLDKQDGIQATRYVFPHLRFNKPRTVHLVSALQSYHRKWDEDKKAFINEEVHDWACHPADMVRYLALVARFPNSRPVEEVVAPPKEDTIIVPTYNFTLDDLWRIQNGQNTRIS